MLIFYKKPIQLDNSIKLVIKITVLILLISYLFSCQRANDAKPNNNVSFIKLVGGAKDDIGYDAVTTHDDAFAFVAYTESFADRGTLSSMLLFKTDKKGNLMWRKSLGGMLGRSLKRTSDNGFIVIGDALFQNTDTLMYVVKTNERGDIQWAKTYTAPIEVGGRTVRGININIDKDGNYWLLANIVKNAASSSVYLLKIDKQGNILRERVYGFSQKINEVNKLLYTSDNTLLVAGTLEKSSRKNIRLFLADSLANLRWDFEYGEENRNESATDLQELPSGYLITGSLQREDTDLGDFLILKTDKNGIKEFQTGAGTANFDLAQSIAITNDGGYIIAGYTEKNDDGKRHKDILIIKTDFAGQVQWQKILGAGRDDETTKAIQLADGTYLVLGTIGFESNKMIGIIRLDKNGDFIE